MKRDTALPLHVFQVLEEEYESLHGPLPAGTEPAHVPDRRTLEESSSQRSSTSSSGPAGGDNDCRWREVQSERSWRFLPGHVKDPVLLAAQLIPRDAEHAADFARIPPDLKQTLPSHDLARENLKIHIYKYRKSLRDLCLRLIELPADDNERRAVSAEDERQLDTELNDLLRDKKLYHADRFSPVWLSSGTSALINQREQHGQFRGGPANPAEDDYTHDLAHFNRMLLEDAFPELERVHDVRLAAICRRLHEARPAALSLSGGGIRSGTFALGLLQGFARHDLLKEFDYLSTVSGGGYIGSWLTAWLHRHPEGLRGVTRDLSNRPPAGKIDPEPQPLLYLRQYSNFITPEVGLLTADTWAFVGIYLRNLLLNWAVIVPLLLAALLLPRLLVTLTLMQPEVPNYIFRVSHPAVAYQGGFPFFSIVNRVFDFHGRHVFLLLGFLLGVWAVAYIGFNRPALRPRLWRMSRFWRERSDQRNFIFWCLAPLVASGVLLTTYFAWSQEVKINEHRWLALLNFLAFGALFGVGAFTISTVILRRWRRAARDQRNRRKQDKRRSVLPYAFALLLSVVSGSLLFWGLAQFSNFAKPVVAYTSPGVDPAAAPEKLAPIFDYLNWRGLTDWTTEIYVCAAVPLFLLVVWGATTLFVGLSSRREAITDEDREWWARFGAWLLIAAIVWVGFFSLVIFGPLALLESPRLLGAAGGISGLVALLLGRSSRTPANRDEEAKGGIVSKLTGSLLPLLAMVFLAVILAALSLGTSYAIRGIAYFAQPGYEKDETAAARCLNHRAAERLNNVPCDEGAVPLKTIQDVSTGERKVPIRPSPLTGYGTYLNYLALPTPTPPPPSPEPTPAPTSAPAPTATSARATEQYSEAAKDSHPLLTQAKLTHMNVVHHTSFWFVGGLLLLLGGLGFGLSRVINLNIFSLHAGYRNRLIRGFLGASRPPGERRPNPFTGFDPEDNVPMHALRPGLLDEDDLLDAPGLKARLLLAPPDPTPDSPPDAAAQLTARLAPFLERTRKAPDSDGADLRDAIRTDLNRALVELPLYEEFARDFIKTPRARKIVDLVRKAHGVETLSRDTVRSDYHILLNRLVLGRAYGNLIKPAPYPPPPYKLLHVVNTALNLVGGDNLAWQQRKAEPFSISPLHSGCFRLGYRRSRDYGGRDTGGISLGTAAAISGAAASSNMGYYTTSPVLSLLLTLFNVRLGWWLGNPGPAGRDTYFRHAPTNSVTPVISEAFGMTDDRNEYVYLTDGGHFENLALYEMVLRRCRVIVCSDGAQDEEYRFGDLGNAVRKIRIDLGVPVEFTSVPIYAEEPDPGKGKGRGFYWAVGKIRYSCVDWGAEDGVLIYIKPAVYGDEPRDILEYKKSFPAFPHQSTGDQFFDEPQFESYRALGSHVMDRLCHSEGKDEIKDLYDLVRRASSKLTEGTPPADTGLAGWLRDWLDEHAPPADTPQS